MSHYVVLLVNLGEIEKIRKERFFGERIAEAVRNNHSPNDNVHIISEDGTVLATVIGTEFHITSTKIVIVEEGVGWLASGTWRPAWSKVTHVDATEMIFGKKE